MSRTKSQTPSDIAAAARELLSRIPGLSGGVQIETNSEGHTEVRAECEGETLALMCTSVDEQTWGYSLRQEQSSGVTVRHAKRCYAIAVSVDDWQDKLTVRLTGERRVEVIACTVVDAAALNEQYMRGIYTEGGHSAGRYNQHVEAGDPVWVAEPTVEEAVTAGWIRRGAVAAMLDEM